MYILEVLCALAVAVLCTDVEALVSEVVTIDGPVVKYDRKLFQVTCGGSNCKVVSISVEYEYGGLSVYAEYGDQNGGYGFCISSDPTAGSFSCGRKTLTANNFTIRLTPDKPGLINENNLPSFQDAELTVELDNSEILITELSAEGASVQEDPKTGQKYVRIKSGYVEKTLPYSEDQVRVKCNGNCEGVQFISEKGNGLILAASEGEPVFVHEKGCYNCFCTSNNSNRNKCINSENEEEFNLNSDEAYITLVPDQSFKDVVASFKGSNIQSIQLYYPWDSYKTLDESVVGVRRILGPIQQGQYVHLRVHCMPGTICRNTKIEVEGNGPLTEIRAGNNTQIDSSGNCPGCNCNDEQSCKTRFDPYQGTDCWTGHFCFYVTIKLPPGGRQTLAYVKVYDQNIRSVSNIYFPYRRKSYYP